MTFTQNLALKTAGDAEFTWKMRRASCTRLGISVLSRRWSFAHERFNAVYIVLAVVPALRSRARRVSRDAGPSTDAAAGAAIVRARLHRLRTRPRDPDEREVPVDRP